MHVVENGHQPVGHQRMDTNGTPASCTTSWRTHVLGSDMAIGGVLIVQWSRPASRPACFDPDGHRVVDEFQDTGLRTLDGNNSWT